MWVESAGKKVSFCLIILARVAADTLSANPLTTPSPRLDGTWELREHEPVGFSHSLPKKQQRAPPGGCRRRFGFAPPCPLGRCERCITNPVNFRKALNVIRKPSVPPTSASLRRRMHQHGGGRVEAGMIPALGNWSWRSRFWCQKGAGSAFRRRGATCAGRGGLLRRNTISPSMEEHPPQSR